MNQYSETMQWDINLFKQEIIFCVAILHKGVLLKPDMECDPYN
jgi:hypothetical protein